MNARVTCAPQKLLSKLRRISSGIHNNLYKGTCPAYAVVKVIKNGWYSHFSSRKELGFLPEPRWGAVAVGLGTSATDDETHFGWYEVSVTYKYIVPPFTGTVSLLGPTLWYKRQLTATELKGVGRDDPACSSCP